MTERLAVSRSVTLDAAGSGSIFVGPSKYAEVWEISRISTRGTSALEPLLQIYRGAIGTMLLDKTSRGNKDISDNSTIEVQHGETLACVYTGGTAGSIMTMLFEGEITRVVR